MARRAFLTTLTCSSTPRSVINVAFLLSPSKLILSASVGLPLMATYLRLSSSSSHRCSSACFPATRPRKIAASKIRKKHVPAYAPVLPGVHAEEKRVVEVEEKKVDTMLDIGIFDDILEELDIVDMWCDMMSMKRSHRQTRYGNMEGKRRC